VKIKKVEANNKKRVFVVHTARAVFEFPYARCDIGPTADDRLVRVYVDPELANEGFTWVLESGQEDSLHIDHVLSCNEDPTYMADLQLYNLTVEVLKLVEASSMSKREMIRRLRTSPAQLYRVLDATNHRTSFRQLLALLHLLKQVNGHGPEHGN